MAYTLSVINDDAANNERVNVVVSGNLNDDGTLSVRWPIAKEFLASELAVRPSDTKPHVQRLPMQISLKNRGVALQQFLYDPLSPIGDFYDDRFGACKRLGTPSQYLAFNEAVELDFIGPANQAFEITLRGRLTTAT